MDTSAIIDRLGGTGKTAEICRVTSPAVALWRTSGIPPKHWGAIVRHAEAQRIPGITFDSVQAARAVARSHTEAAD